MTFEIALVFIILIVAVVFLITEWIPMEITALLTLGAVALTGLVTPVDALSGFSNPAVVTVWAVFILSGGLTKTGVADVIGKFVLRLGGSKETTMIVVIMTTAGIMSAIMNNVAVAALMLPVVMNICKQTGRSPSRLLMPLAYGCLLGGLTTQIGTPPNILVSDALRDVGLESFGFFDFTPIGLLMMCTGIGFMTLIGRHMLPRRVDGEEMGHGDNTDWQSKYELKERLFHVRIPGTSPLAGKSLAQVRMGSILGWNVIGITRGGRRSLVPGPHDMLLAGDLLTVEGRFDAVRELQNRHKLIVEEEALDIEQQFSGGIRIAEIALAEDSHFSGATLNTLGFRARFGVNVLALRRGNQIKRTGLQDTPLQPGDFLLIAGTDEYMDSLAETKGFAGFRYVETAELSDVYNLYERLMLMEIAEESALVNLSLKESRLGDAFSSRIFGILRGGTTLILPEPQEILQAGDRLLVEGDSGDFEILRGLEELEIEQSPQPDVDTLMSGNIGLGEAILSPQTVLEGKTMRQINFREKFGLNVLALWRRGRTHRSDLRDMQLHFGDALLLYGSRKKLQLLAREPDFIVLTETIAEDLRPEKMKTALLLMALVLLPVFFGLVPIYIAAVVGAAFMVVTGCLTMEEAYRQIEWKAVFLIAGMLPLGTALDQTGAARLIAEGVVALVGPYGPSAIMFGLIGLTFAATCFVPTAALVVLMAPIVFNTSAGMGLSPHGLLMAVAMAASASFMTPVSHPANILIMGPGGYTFMDYIKVGGLMTLVIFGVLMLALPVLWPLTL